MKCEVCGDESYNKKFPYSKHDPQQCIFRLKVRIDELAQALFWYLEDDKRSVEEGILEKVEDRPAASVLKGEL
ncbi:hypothetical protein LCGC14_0857240 [marine sediment metagenome]|uniref:Uncharacterized protein n=1 Tax=marine sediment metagenome TaxID=412755 RepID=A0A0F9SFI4_9ZZZZ